MEEIKEWVKPQKLSCRFIPINIQLRTTLDGGDPDTRIFINLNLAHTLHTSFTFLLSSNLTQTHPNSFLFIKLIPPTTVHILLVNLFLKGVTGNVWWLNWDCSIVEIFFRIHLRHIKPFKDLYLLSLSAKSTFKIINLGSYVLRISFFLIIK